MNKLTILLDLDDVIIPLLPNWINAINKKYGTNVHHNDITDWKVDKFFPTLTKEQVFSPVLSNKFWFGIKPYDDSCRVIDKLINAGHTVKIVTATDYRTVRVKSEMIFKYFPMLTWKDIIITHCKSMINADVLVDDKIGNLIGGNYHKILINKPHNINYIVEEYGIERADNLTEAYEIICRLSDN